MKKPIKQDELANFLYSGFLSALSNALTKDTTFVDMLRGSCNKMSGELLKQFNVTTKDLEEKVQG